MFPLCLLASGLIAQLAFCLPAPAGTQRTQQLQLQAGWNAVFLEVYPEDAEPAAVFANTPIDIAASYYAPSSPAQFVSDPSADLFRQAGWGVWYAEDRPDAFLKTLHAIHGQQAYLVHSRSAFTWRVTGAVVPAEVRWQADAFNLVGFAVDAQAPPTFAQFFSGSLAHRHNRIYRLTNGTWRQATSPAAETMRSGEAFWVYSYGGSKFQGPLHVQTPLRQGLVLRTGADALTLRNQADHPVIPTLEHIAAGADAVPLAIVIQAVGDQAAPVRSIPVAKPDGSWKQALPAIEAGGALRVPLEARRADQDTFARSPLLKISTDVGTEVWIPVVSVREDLEK